MGCLNLKQLFIRCRKGKTEPAIRTVVVAGLMGLLPVSGAHGSSINVNPVSTVLNNSYFNLEDAALSDRAFSGKQTLGRVNAQINYNYDSQPWILLSADGLYKKSILIDSIHTLGINVSWLMNAENQLGFETFGSKVAVNAAYGGDDTFHFGDTRLIYKHRLYTSTFWNIALSTELTLPTGVGYIGSPYGASLSNSSFGPGSTLIAEYRTTKNQWTMNAGYSYFSEAEVKTNTNNYPNIDGRSKIFLGVGWLSRMTKNWSLDTEYTTRFSTSTNNFTPPGLFTVGGRYQAPGGTTWQFGAGTGSIGKMGGNSPLLYAGINIPFKTDSTPSPNGDAPTSSSITLPDDDLLLQEAYKNHKERALRQEQNRDETTHSNYNPIDEETGKALFTGDELTKKALE